MADQAVLKYLSIDTTFDPCYLSLDSTFKRTISQDQIGLKVVFLDILYPLSWWLELMDDI